MSAQPTSPSPNHAPRAVRFNTEWITRPLFGILLAGIAVMAVFSGPRNLAIFIGLAFGLAALEWHRCVGPRETYLIEAAVTTVCVALAEAALLYSGLFWAALLVVVLGTGAAFALARTRHKHPLWQAASIPYLAIPAVSLVALCGLQRGPLLVIGMLLIVWATDTGALIFGKLIGGPRLAPKLSPGKTWAGTIGGSLAAALVYCLYLMLLGRSWGWGAPFAFLFSFAAHGGDLVESFVKRRFGLKNSGSLIPGHGGVLDRIDSTLMAAPVLALLVFVAHLDPLFEVHP